MYVSVVFQYVTGPNAGIYAVTFMSTNFQVSLFDLQNHQIRVYIINKYIHRILKS